MSELTRQQLCAALSVSESTLQRFEREGMPFKAVPWSKRKTYNEVQCRVWLNQRNPGRVAPPSNLRNFYSANARAKMLGRMPAWADKKAIRAFFEEAQRLTWASGIPHHVDHQVPMQGELVSGLHVPNNLQILTGSENSKKRNHYEVAA